MSISYSSFSEICCPFGTSNVLEMLCLNRNTNREASGAKVGANLDTVLRQGSCRKERAKTRKNGKRHRLIRKREISDLAIDVDTLLGCVCLTQRCNLLLFESVNDLRCRLKGRNSYVNLMYCDPESSVPSSPDSPDVFLNHRFSSARSL